MVRQISIKIYFKMKYVGIYRPTAVLYEEEIHNLYIVQK